MSRRGYRGKGNRVTHNRTSGGNSPLKQPQVMFLASLGIVAALLIRYQFIDFKSNDYNAFLSHWLQYFRDNGGFSALGKRIGDYNVPYLYFMALFSYIPVSGLYLIKLLSVIFDILLAYTAMKLVTLLTNRNDFGVAAFILVLLLPTVTVNSSMWGQCDSIYTSLGLLALYYGLKKKPILSVSLAALAFSFKLQVIFLLPIFAVLLFTDRIKIRHLFAFPVVYFLVFLPAAIMGRPVIDAILIYTNQVGSYSSFLTLNAPSIYALLGSVSDRSLFTAIGIIIAFLTLLSLLLYLLLRRKRLDIRTITISAALMVQLIPFLLPSMHERYFYLSDILSVISSFASPWLIPVPILVQLGSWSGYHAYLFGGGIGIELGAKFMLAAAVILLIYLIFSIEKGRRRSHN
ncbi:MAG: conjugal transfer protein TraL [Clostridiales bacterium]|jgi:Gpi18-like mannosyltransferase|nr:conjugal transfer protein TraL [Clostridiales bacterium]